MELYELTQLIEKVNSNVSNRWSFFLIVILAIAGGLISKKEHIKWKHSVILIIGLLSGFAGNGYGIHKSVKTIQMLEGERRAFIQSNDENEISDKIYTDDFRDYLEGKPKYSAIMTNWYLLYIALSIVIIVLVLAYTDVGFLRRN